LIVTKSEQNALAVVDFLLGSGWAEDGHTDTQTVRIGTSKVPIYGKTGGELRTFGGRQRLAKTGTEWKVTVGTRTVNFYRVGNIDVSFRNYKGEWIEKFERGSVDLKGFDTKDLDGIRAHAESLS
jgi:hypothetical protein